MESDRTVFGIAGASDAREALAVLAACADLRAEVYGSVDEYLSKSDPAQPGCLVLDMSATSGVELINALANHGQRPIVLITGKGQRITGFPNGAFFEVIQKPFQPQVLLDCIHRAIGRDLRVPI